MAEKNVRVAINGFGRIGRLAFREMFGAEGYTIVAINDLAGYGKCDPWLQYGPNHMVPDFRAVQMQSGQYDPERSKYTGCGTG